jgi:signal transduction histidine kinase
MQRNPRYFWRFHVPLVSAFAAVFFVPAVRRFADVDPWAMAGLVLLHLIGYGSEVLTSLPDRHPVAYYSTDALWHLGVAAAIPGLTGRADSALWAAYLIQVVVLAEAGGPCVLTGAAVIGMPFLVGLAWHVQGTAPLPGTAPALGVVAALALLVWLAIGRLNDELWRARRQQAELERAAAEDEERRRIARDLHDTLGATLTELGLWLDIGAVPGAEQAREAARRARRCASDAHAELRACVASLGRREVSPADLETIVRARVRGLCEAAGVAHEVRFAAARETVDARAAFHVAKIVEEAVANAVRHGRPRRVEVDVRVAEVPTVEVGDDGAGFGPEAAARPGHGWAWMRERARLLGAEFAVESAAGRGTRVRVGPAEGAR